MPVSENQFSLPTGREPMIFRVAGVVPLSNELLKRMTFATGIYTVSLESLRICEGEICGPAGTLLQRAKIDSAWQVHAVKSLFNLKRSR